ncbi:hypothetical protein KXR53_10035 [Inquilinus limosus]|uniref:hypothetical protein n=1 Tax=Inquilinus limosus TaxID=171674 RepID=UPI003F135A45
MHDATSIRPARPDTAAIAPAIDPEHIEPGWSPPVERLALSWDEVAASWLAACGLLAILGVAAIIGREPVGEPVILSAGLPGVGLTAGAEDCHAAGPADGTGLFIFAPPPQGGPA